MNHLSTKTDNCEKVMKLIKEKVFVSDRDQAIQMLTLVPDDWSIPKTADYFEVTQYTVKQARRLKQEKGVLSTPEGYSKSWYQ